MAGAEFIILNTVWQDSFSVNLHIGLSAVLPFTCVAVKDDMYHDKEM
jgi:hypothetical protein